MANDTEIDSIGRIAEAGKGRGLHNCDTTCNNEPYYMDSLHMQS